MAPKVRISKTLKKKKYPTIAHAILHMAANFNNTILSLCDDQGNVLRQLSCGMFGFKNTKKSTPFASQVVITKMLEQASTLFGVKSIDLIIKGPGQGREMLTFFHSNAKITVNSINDRTSKPHGGVRQCRRRRV